MPDDNSPLFGENLRAARKQAGMSQQTLANRSGIDRTTISLIENDRESPRSDTILRLARVLNIDPAELWRGDSSEDRAEVADKESSEVDIQRYEPLHDARLHPGLEELLSDDRARLMLNLTDEEEMMLRSIRTRRDAPLGKDFFIDVLISYRRHHG